MYCLSVELSTQIQPNLSILLNLKGFTGNLFHGKPTQIISHNDQLFSRFLLCVIQRACGFSMHKSVLFHNHPLSLLLSLSACGSGINRTFQVSGIEKVHCTDTQTHTQATQTQQTQMHRQAENSQSCKHRLIHTPTHTNIHKIGPLLS